MFLEKGGIKEFGWFQKDETNTVDAENTPTYFRSFMQVVVKQWYDEMQELRKLGFQGSDAGVRTSLEKFFIRIMQSLQNLS